MPGTGIVRVLVAAMVVGLLQALVPVPPARAAQDVLVTSDPYRHQQLDGPPGGVVLAFARAVDAERAEIVVTNSAGRNVNINSLIVEGTNVMAQLRPNLPMDTYTVHYQVNRADGDIEGGAYQFSYGKGHWTKLTDERWSGSTAQPTVLVSPSQEPATTASGTPSPTPADTATSEPPSAAPSATATPTATPGGIADDPGGFPWPWVGLGALVVVGAAGGYAFSRRNRPRGPGRRQA